MRLYHSIIYQFAVTYENTENNKEANSMYELSVNFTCQTEVPAHLRLNVS